MSSSKNLEYQKTSFLSKSNSAFIEEMYLKFINKDTDLPESWKKYFSQIGEELDIVAKEINGPSWGPSKKKANLLEIKKKFETQYENIPEQNTINKVVNINKFSTATCHLGIDHNLKYWSRPQRSYIGNNFDFVKEI